jgi:hypothetical protein
VKRSLLGLHLLYQLLNPIERSLIRDAGRQVLVMLDFAIARRPLLDGGNITTCNYYDGYVPVLFQFSKGPRTENIAKGPWQLLDFST